MIRCWKTRYITIFFSILFLIPVFSMAQVAFQKDFNAALKQAAREKKFIVLDISASWCPHCQKMTRAVDPDKDFIEFSKSQIFMRFVFDTDSEGARLARKFRVNGYPTLIILDSNGDEVDRIVGERSAPELIAKLRSIFQESKTGGESGSSNRLRSTPVLHHQTNYSGSHPFDELPNVRVRSSSPSHATTRCRGPRTVQWLSTRAQYA